MSQSAQPSRPSPNSMLEGLIDFAYVFDKLAESKGARWSCVPCSSGGGWLPCGNMKPKGEWTDVYVIRDNKPWLDTRDPLAVRQQWRFSAFATRNTRYQPFKFEYEPEEPIDMNPRETARLYEELFQLVEAALRGMHTTQAIVAS